ncbi:MAG: Rne/Rng family ribonuclease [Rhodospirillales bacterium]|nr:Rne/Rng family ribonuclease [Rhodospirillales bacterium]
MIVERIIASVLGGETRVALLSADRLIELLIERPGQTSIAGNIYLGRVEGVLQGLQAAFVEIGQERPGFLALAEARPFGEEGGDISDYLSEGDAVIVQIQRDPFADKGAKLTTHISLPGRHIVYLPEQGGIQISRRIEDTLTRERLSATLKGNIDRGEGVILRTSAAEAGEEELAFEIDSLREIWFGITDARSNVRAPALLHREPDLVPRILRDTAGPEIKKIIVDDGASLKAARAYCEKFAPEMSDRIELHNGPGDLFETSGIEAEIDAALAPRVPLPSGGGLIIEETAALTAIDVNTGSVGGSRGDTGHRVNLEAVPEIARQIRLRNLSGLVVVDFVSDKNASRRAEVLRALRREMSSDPVPVHVGGFTTMGLVEMTRRRRREPLAGSLSEPCPSCAGGGWIRSCDTVAFMILRRVLAEDRASPGIQLRVTAAPGVIDALVRGTAAPTRKEVEARLGRELVLSSDPTRAADRFEIGPAPRDKAPDNG